MDQVEALAVPQSTVEKLRRGEITLKDAQRFTRFLQWKQHNIDEHPVIVNNPYTKWFKQGNADTEHVRDLIAQFAVFSRHFPIMQCKRMVNATTTEGEVGARSILVNEIGVAIDMHTGDTEGKTFRHDNAHINWLRTIGETLGFNPRTLGHWDTATTPTQTFIEQLDRVYGSRDGNIGAGASFAIETWAGFGIEKGKALESNNFWKELITGLRSYNRTHRKPYGLPGIGIGFFQYHFNLELAHVANVELELEQVFFNPDFNEERWFEGARQSLQAIYTFWLGLEETRKKLEAQKSAS